MTPPPRLYPETVPGGSLIGSVNSRFAAAFTLYQFKHTLFQGTAESHAPPCNSDFQPQQRDESYVDAELVNIIQNLSRPKIEALVTQAWIRNIPTQTEEKLRDLVTGAVKKGILSHDDIHYTCTNSFICLPTEIQLRIVSYLPLRNRIVFLTQVNSQLRRLAHHPELWKELNLQIPSQSNFSALSTFLTKYTPAKSVESLYFPSTTTSHEFLKFLVMLKRLRSQLIRIHLTGKQVTCTSLAAMESLLGKWTMTIILDNPCAKVDIAHITQIVSAAPRLKVFALQTCSKFSTKEYDGFLRELMRAGETSRIHHRHPEINARLRTLQISSTTMQNVNFSILTDLGKFFPLLEMLRIENWKLSMDKCDETRITPILTLRGLSLIGIDLAITKGFTKMLSVYVQSFPSLEILVLGARGTDILGWKIFNRKLELRGLFNGLELPKLKCLWLRSWIVDCQELVSLKTNALRWIVVEECKGMNGGWVKSVKSKWKEAVVIESDTRLKNGIDFSSYRNLAKSGIRC